MRKAPLKAGIINVLFKKKTKAQQNAGIITIPFNMNTKPNNMPV